MAVPDQMWRPRQYCSKITRKWYWTTVDGSGQGFAHNEAVESAVDSYLHYQQGIEAIEHCWKKYIKQKQTINDKG